jgi:hypothetical protein
MNDPKNTKNTVYSFSASVPDPTLPVIFHQKGTSWVNFGFNNLYPNELITPLYNGSAMNKTCITSKKIYTVGEGLRMKNPEFDYVLKRANELGESWNEIFEKAALDYIIYGGLALQIIWNETGDKITDIYNMDFNDIRSGTIDKDADRVLWYYYSSDWYKYKKDLYKPRAIRAFNPAEADLYPSQILYFFDHTPGNKIYPVPDYSGALTSCQVDVSIDSFHYSNLKNGLNPSLFIQMFNGIPDPSTREEIYQNLAASFSGVENSGKYFLSFANDKDHGTEVTPIDSANDEYYINLSQRISQQILTAHRITSPLLLGIKDLGGAGLTNNKDEITVAALHFQNTTIVPYQKKLLKLFDKLMNYYGYDQELYIQPLNLFNSEGEEVVQENVTAIK